MAARNLGYPLSYTLSRDIFIYTYLTDPRIFPSPFPSFSSLSIIDNRGERWFPGKEANSIFSAAIRSRFGNELPVDSRLVPCNYKLVPFSRGTGTVSIGSRLSRSCLVRTVYISDDNDYRLNRWN